MDAPWATANTRGPDSVVECVMSKFGSGWELVAGNNNKSFVFFQ